MFQNEELLNHLQTSSVIRTNSAVIAEWNMNIAENILKIGNYRYRPSEGPSTKYGLPVSAFDEIDDGNFYTNATDADIVIDGGLNDEGIPLTFTSKKQKEKLLYSLEDCFGKFRPRSGINKLRYFKDNFSHFTNINMIRRPRYYMAHKDDSFKYWSSYRTEDGIERGIANKLINGQHFIDDASPFVVYKNVVPSNRIIVKMQTGVGDIDLGPFVSNAGSFSDPFYGNQNQTTPVKWKVQILKNNNWTDIISFNSGSARRNGNPIIGSDGYVELSYGLKVPERYRDIFIKAEEYTTETFLPEQSVNGYAYLIKEQESDLGTYHIWINEFNGYQTFTPEYGWYLEESQIDRLTNFVTDLTAPVSYQDTATGQTKYREFEEISGIRVVVDTMNKVDSTFDLIELSPRLVVDISEKVESFSLTKSASDLGNSGMPVGQLLAGIGALDLFDYDLAFSSTNTNSIIKNYLTKNIQFKFYEIVVDVNGYDYYVPIKTMYSEGFPEINTNDRSVSLNLRDLFFYFESKTAPQILVQEASLSYAVSMLLDSIGFSNYLFKRIEGTSEPIVPYFFIAPDKTVAQVLNEIAISTQSAMFFDEYNNLVVMTKEHILPSNNERDVDLVLYGTKDFEIDGQISNKATNTKLANIIEIASQKDDVFNDGKITYSTRYIQRSVGSIRQASMIDQDKVWIYKPALLWEVAGTENTKSQNDALGNQSSYVLSAIPLKSDLLETPPTVVNGIIQNNTMDFGESVYWMTRYNGYFYANGEVIKYDAIEFEIPGVQKRVVQTNNNGDLSLNTVTSGGIGKVWITSVREYQKYFAQLPFNGKMYPTGRVRIYSEPNYRTINGQTTLANGAVAKHGRGQFGTPIVNHYAGLSSYWTSNSNVRGCTMKSSQLFGTATETSISVGAAGINNTLAQTSSRTGIIKNLLAYTPSYENISKNIIAPGTVQSSALVFTGPSFTTTETPTDFISYVYKPLNALQNKFKHFGSRIRLIGKVENNENSGQSPIGASSYYLGQTNNPNQPAIISGASGGIGILMNPETNNGYYLEIVALAEDGVLDSYENSADLHNILFYKIGKPNLGEASKAIPIKLWGGTAQILVDSGQFIGQYRMANEKNPTVYDLAVEYEDIGTTRKFFLYINNRLIATVIDSQPLPIYNNMCLFVRGGARAMFENIYAITNNYSQNTSYALSTPVSSVFSSDEIDVDEAFRKYALSGVIQASYLSNISPSEPPKYNIYYEEFGTIMREAAYFNIRYDKAYPALYAKLSPTFNKLKGYTTSGFLASSYGAEFMIFNATDTVLSLDETSGNYLRIQGVTFTQESSHDLTVDEYFDKKSDHSNPQFSGQQLISYPGKAKQEYQDIKVSRLTHGRKEFTLDTPYIQSHDDAENLMGWIISKIMKPRRSIGVRLFGLPVLQLGDIVSINYKDSDSIDIVAPEDSRFVVYQIEYSTNPDGPEMTAFLSEVK
jgi:hypothetical protein